MNQSSLSQEQILLFSRNHPMSFFGRLMLFTALFLMPFILVPVWFSGIPAQLVALILCTYYLIWVDLAFIEWVKFYYDSLVITPDHMIVVQQKGVFDRTVMQFHLSQVVESTAKTSGMMPNLFSYGTIVIQTAGPEENIVLKNVPKPFEVSERIMRIHDQVMKKQR